MSMLHLQLPGDVEKRLRAQAAADGFGTIEEYAEALLRATTEEQFVDPETERILLERLDDPRPPIEFNAEFKEQFMDQVRRRRQAEGKQP